jgi:DNA-directed RNA polymerase specialized sigma24 family protein
MAVSTSPVVSMDSDEWTMWRAGSAEISALFELRGGALRFACQSGRRVVKDLVQAFLRLWWQARVDLALTAQLLHTIVRYQALDHLRRRRIEERWRQEYAAPAMVEQGPLLGGGGPEQDLAAKEIAQAIGRAVRALPQRQQQVLLLRWQHQASYADRRDLGIAGTVGVHAPPGSAP